MAVERGQILMQFAQVQELINTSQEVIGRNMII
jgi:hypothetical protein